MPKEKEKKERPLLTVILPVQTLNELRGDLTASARWVESCAKATIEKADKEGDEDMHAAGGNMRVMAKRLRFYAKHAELIPNIDAAVISAANSEKSAKALKAQSYKRNTGEILTLNSPRIVEPSRRYAQMVDAQCRGRKEGPGTGRGSRYDKDRLSWRCMDCGGDLPHSLSLCQTRGCIDARKWQQKRRAK